MVSFRRVLGPFHLSEPNCFSIKSLNIVGVGKQFTSLLIVVSWEIPLKR